MNWDAIDWEALERLRAAFLEGTAGARDYWRGESDLDSYDQTFAQRIGWKWDYVLNELKRRHWSPPPGDVMDWGCGSGIASRRFFAHFPSHAVNPLTLWDRSPLAMAFAARKAKEQVPNLIVRTGSPAADNIGTLLISHVITELAEQQIDDLLALATNATAVIWVEPGTFEASRTLIAIREKLLGTFHVAAPCTHQAACGMLLPENQRHWCHHFAAPPPDVFRDGNWARFARIAGIDLRSLPVSLLVLDKRPQPPPAPDAVRIIGQPRVYKAHALALGCDANGVRESRLTKRAVPDEFRRLKKGLLDPLQLWQRNGDEIISAIPLPPH